MNRTFRILKLRTMVERFDGAGTPLPDSERLTRLGRFMRNTSIDELPQLLNVLIGDMSLIGPRPQISSFVAAMSATERRRHEVPPGLSGWSQINGRNAVSWTERFDQDVWYVDNASFALDMRILMLTPSAILSGRNIRNKGHATMPSLLDERREIRAMPDHAAPLTG